MYLFYYFCERCTRTEYVPSPIVDHINVCLTTKRKKRSGKYARRLRKYNMSQIFSVHIRLCGSFQMSTGSNNNRFIYVFWIIFENRFVAGQILYIAHM